jgi:hypothetical protein
MLQSRPYQNNKIQYVLPSSIPHKQKDVNADNVENQHEDRHYTSNARNSEESVHYFADRLEELLFGRETPERRYR